MFIHSFRTLNVPMVSAVPELGIYNSFEDPGTPIPAVFIFDAQESDVDVTILMDADPDGDGTFNKTDILSGAKTLVAHGFLTIVNPQPGAKSVQFRCAASKPVSVHVTAMNRHSGVQR